MLPNINQTALGVYVWFGGARTPDSRKLVLALLTQSQLLRNVRTAFAFIDEQPNGGRIGRGAGQRASDVDVDGQIGYGYEILSTAPTISIITPSIIICKNKSMTTATITITAENK